MKTLSTLALFLCLAGSLAAQTKIYRDQDYRGTHDFSNATALKLPLVGSDQSGSCSTNDVVVRNSTNNKLFACTGGTWQQLSGTGGVSPSSSGLQYWNGSAWVAVTGTATDCVKVNGTSNTCGTGTGATDLSGLADCKATATSTTLTIAACSVVVGDKVVAVPGTTATISGTASSGNVGAYFSPGGTKVSFFTSSALTVTPDSSGVFAPGVTTWPANVARLAMIPVASNALTTTSLVGYRTLLQVDTVRPGAGMRDVPNPDGTITRNVDPQQLDDLTYKADTGTANAYAIAIDNPILILTDGLTVTFKVANANTGASTLSVNGLGTPQVVKKSGTSFSALSTNDFIVGQIVTAKYDLANTRWQCMSCAGGGTSSGVTEVNVPIHRAPGRCNPFQSAQVGDFFFDNATGPAGLTCTSGNQQWGALRFQDPGSGATHAITDAVIPANWTGVARLKLFGTSFNSGNVRFEVKKQCFGVGSDPGTISWGGAESVTAVTDGSGTWVQHNFTLNLTGLSCSAGKILMLRVERIAAASGEATNNYDVHQAWIELPHN